MSAMVRAFGYVLVIMLTGYLVGAASVGALEQWFHSMTGGM